MSDFVYASDGSPEGYVLDVVPGTSGVDLSEVTSAIFRFKMDNGKRGAWTCNISAQTTTTVTLTHVFGDLDVYDVGASFHIYARMALSSGGYCRTATRKLVIKDEFEVTP